MMNPREILQKLNAFVFHDLPVENVGWVKAEPTTFQMDVFLYKEEKQEYDRVRIFFKQVEMFKSDPLEVEPSELELYRFWYEYNETFKCRLQFLTGLKGPSREIEFACATIEIKEE